MPGTRRRFITSIRRVRASKSSICCRISRRCSALTISFCRTASPARFRNTALSSRTTRTTPADDGAELIASDQHPDHDVQQGEVFIATVYNAIRQNPDLWQSTALLIVYDEHGGTYDHVPPPACTPDGFSATPDQTGVPGLTFLFDRLGVRVPAILISPWVAKGTVVRPRIR